MNTIDLTPTWASLVPVLMHIAKHSESPSGLRDVTDELTKMARAADLWNAHCKEQIATLEQVAVARKEVGA
jgi:hypothetical protein